MNAHDPYYTIFSSASSAPLRETLHPIYFCGTTSTCYPCYDANEQQKSVKGKALQQPDRDFEACARFNEHKSEERYSAKERQQFFTAYVDELGNPYAEYAYDAFGNTINQSGDLASTFSHRFSTKYADDETGLYYYGYRYYAPELGRWVNRDPIEEQGGVNQYLASRNNAVGLIDSLGLCPIFVTEDESGVVTEARRASDIKLVTVDKASSFGKVDRAMDSGGGAFMVTPIFKGCDFSIRMSIYYITPKKIYKSGTEYSYHPHATINIGNDSRQQGDIPFEALRVHEGGHAYGYWWHGGADCAKRVHDKWAGKKITNAIEGAIIKELEDCMGISRAWGNFYANEFTINYFDISARERYTRTYPKKAGQGAERYYNPYTAEDYWYTDKWKAK
jgi:RHS repeat-associated protein